MHNVHILYIHEQNVLMIMTQEDKEILLKDLSARMQYGVKVQFKTNSVIENKYKFIYNVDGEYEYINIGKSNLTLDIIKMLSNNCIDEIKPYLFPMSNMTEEEKLQLSKYACIGEDLNGEFIDEVQRKDCAAYIDWLNKNHFDYRGLIPKGLAIEVTKENNPYKLD